MAREFLQIDGVPTKTKNLLQQSANELFGKPNASLMVRSLIDSHLLKLKPENSPLKLAPDEETVRVEIRLPKTAFDELNRRAESRLSARNHYLVGLILAGLGKPQLQGDEIETLRRSNYELMKVGTNINQIAKGFNTMVQQKQAGDKVPEVGKRIAALRRDITEHTNRVLRVLEAGSVLWDARGNGQRKPKIRK